MLSTRRSTTTKDIALLLQLYRQKQLVLDAEFQRNSVWPKAAKAYLLDTILSNRPIPLFFMQRSVAPDDGRTNYVVIDGQQRLRAVFEFCDDKFRLSENSDKSIDRKLFSELTAPMQHRILEYDLTVEELSGYSENDIRDVFVRMNKYVVKLSPQEMRNARGSGKFHDFANAVATWDFWDKHGVFTANQIARMRPAEFAAELAILVLEGPQDKKAAVDLYYVQYREEFAAAKAVRDRLKIWFDWIDRALPDLHKTRFKKAVDLYGVIGALESLVSSSKKFVDPKAAGKRLRSFNARLEEDDPDAEAARYLLAASQQTDNIQPRTTRIDTLARIIRG